MERNDTGLDGAAPALSGGLSEANEFSGSATTSPTEAEVPAGSTASSGSTYDDVSTTGPSGIKAKLNTAKEKVVDSYGVAKEWVREKDIDAIKAGVEQQVKEHPGRTLLIAVGLGYLIGRAFRNGSGT